MEVVVVQSPEPDRRHAMRLTTRMSFATLTGLCLVLALAPGCSSRKKVTPEANVNPPETESTAPAPPEKEEAPPPVETPTERRSMEDAFFGFDDFSLRQVAKSALGQSGKVPGKTAGPQVGIWGVSDEADCVG